VAKWTARATNIGPTAFSGEIRGHRITGDVPEELGGHNAGALPPEWLPTALAGCMGTVIALACRERGVPYDGMTVEVECDDITDEHRLANFKMKITMPETLTEHDRQVVVAAESLCRVRNTLMHGAEVTVEVAP